MTTLNGPKTALAVITEAQWNQLWTDTFYEGGKHYQGMVKPIFYATYAGALSPLEMLVLYKEFHDFVWSLAKGYKEKYPSLYWVWNAGKPEQLLPGIVETLKALSVPLPTELEGYGQMYHSDAWYQLVEEEHDGAWTDEEMESCPSWYKWKGSCKKAFYSSPKPNADFFCYYEGRLKLWQLLVLYRNAMGMSWRKWAHKSVLDYCEKHHSFKYENTALGSVFDVIAKAHWKYPHEVIAGPLQPTGMYMFVAAGKGIALNSPKSGGGDAAKAAPAEPLPQESPEVAVQASMRGDLLHVQGKGKPVNRDYGVTVNLKVPLDCLEHVVKHGSIVSLAGPDNKDYVSGTARYEGGHLKLRLAGYGKKLRVSDGSARFLHTFVQKMAKGEEPF